MEYLKEKLSLKFFLFIGLAFFLLKFPIIGDCFGELLYIIVNQNILPM